jgi:hypothetical protein
MKKNTAIPSGLQRRLLAALAKNRVAKLNSQRSAVKHAISSAVLTSAGVPVAHACGSFVLLKLQAGAMQQVLPWVSPELSVDALYRAAREPQPRRRAHSNRGSG